MALSGARAKSGPGPRATGSRIGPDLWPRVAAATVMGVVALAAAWTGGFVFMAFWCVASLIVLWEWQRLVGAERLFGRVAAGALALVVASSFALQNLFSIGQAVVGSVIALALGAAAVAWIARPGSKDGRVPG